MLCRQLPRFSTNEAFPAQGGGASRVTSYYVIYPTMRIVMLFCTLTLSEHSLLIRNGTAYYTLQCFRALTASRPVDALIVKVNRLSLCYSRIINNGAYPFGLH